MRIISGICKGRKLVQIEGNNIRPTSDRVREALFNILGSSVKGAKVLDLFAGTGALGLEALSRGAKLAFFVDQSETACRIIRENLQRCSFEEMGLVVCRDIMRDEFTEQIEYQAPFDLIFMDPPYKRNFVLLTLQKDFFLKFIEPYTIIVVEHSIKDVLTPIPNYLDFFRQKKYSKTIISFLMRNQCS